MKKRRIYISIADERHRFILANHLSLEANYPAAILDCVSSGGAHVGASTIGAEYTNLSLLLRKISSQSPHQVLQAVESGSPHHSS